MKFLLLGANGQVGHELRRSLAPLGEIVATTRSGELPDGGRCEVADFDQPDSLDALVQRIAPDIVINAAAYTAVDRAEDEPEAAYRANALAPGVLAAACARRDALLVHYSTDYVFDGNATRPYREDDPTAPLGVYGASKLAGEQAIGAAGCRHMVFRTAWVYGNHGNNFMRTMLRLATESDQLRVVADQFGTPTPASLIADVTASALQTAPHHSGLWHLTAAGEATWHVFAREIVEQAAVRGLLSRIPEVMAIATADYPTRARRPHYSRMDNSKLEKTFGITMRDWRSGLAQVLDAAAP